MKICKKLPLLLLTVILSSLLFANTSYALGKVGHKVVCQIAYEHLTPSIQHKVNELLTHLPKQHKNLINKYNYKSNSTAISYIDTCSWADAIKRDKSFDKYKSWHYISVQRDANEVTESSCDKNCITNAIVLHKDMLANETNEWRKLQALMFLSHWLGDIHQPMHVGFSSDRGGNSIKIKYNETKCENMHWLWDECLLYPTSKVRDQDRFYESVYNKVSARWKNSPINLWQQDSLYTWATESLNIGKTPSVMYCHIDKNNACIPLTKILKNKANRQVVKLPESYQSTHQPILEKRLLQAGARLAETLTVALK